VRPSRRHSGNSVGINLTPSMKAVCTIRFRDAGQCGSAPEPSGREWLCARSYGKDASTSSTLYKAASLSKLVTAVAALRLVEQGTLDLDRNVS